MAQFIRILRDRGDMVALAAVLGYVVFIPKPREFSLFQGGLEPAIIALGLLAGAAISLHAIGVVLVYRSNRIINFAQVQIGIIGAAFFSIFVTYTPHFRWIQDSICPPCFEVFNRTTYYINYFLILAVALGFSMLLGWGLYHGIIRRFSGAPRLILTVATIFLAQLLAGAQASMLSSESLFTAQQLREGVSLSALPLPFDWSLVVGGADQAQVTFNTAQILTGLLVAAAVVGLVVYFGKSRTGAAIRAAADNPSRLETLGVNVGSVTSRVWLIAGFLSGLAAILPTISTGIGTSIGGISVSVLIRILAAAVVARMVSIPVTVGAALVFGILEQSFQWAYGSTIVLDGFLFAIIAVVLLLQRYKASRSDLEQASAWKAAREVRPIPAELKDVPVVRAWRRWGAVILAVAILGFPWVMSPSQTTIAGAVMIYAMVFLSLLVLTGWAGQISLGQFAFAAVGGWVVASIGLPLLPGLLVAGVVGAVVAVIVGIPALKLRGLHLAITTLAFALAVSSILLNPNYGGKNLPSSLESPAVFGVSFDQQEYFYYFILLMLVLVTIGVLGIRRSRTARALIGARDNEPAAQSFGINLVRARLTAFAISGFIAAMAGGIFAFQQHGVRPTAFTPEQSITVFLFTVIGGLGGVAGPLIGALYYGILLIAGTSQVAQLVGSGLGGLILLFTFPGGLSQAVYDTRDAFLKWVARRNRIVVPSLLEDVRLDSRGRERSAIAPNRGKGGASRFIPHRYRLQDQWLIDEDADEGRESPKGLVEERSSG